ncbi:MAG: pyridoxal phosphate-dependent aminotransferase, partial [Psychrobacillus psychrotolerans]
MSIFSTVFNRRNTYSAKWDMLEQVYSINNASEVLPMWVADMDFAIPSVIIEALQTRMEHPVFGYSMAPEETKSSLTKWVADKHQVTIQNEWIMFRQGVIPGIAEVIEAFTEVGDKVLIHT